VELAPRTDDQQFSVRTFVFQPFQKFNEFGSVVAVLQRAIAAHVQVAHKVIFLCRTFHQLRPGEIFDPDGQSVRTRQAK